MTKKKRTILFIVCAVLFILITPSVIFYSQGYRFDFETKKVVQTGGFYFKVFPRNAEIYLNGKLKTKTSVLTSSTLIKNLLPKTYEIQIKKEGYHSWQKSLEIYEKQVTEAKNIILFPENPKFETLTKNVNNFWFSPDGKKIAIYELNYPPLATTSPSRIDKEPSPEWTLKLYELEKNIKSHLIGAKDIYSGGVDLLNLEFSQDSKEIYLNVGMKEQEKNFVLELNKFPPVLIKKETTSPPEDVITSQTFDNKIYYLDDSGYVFKADSLPLSLQERVGVKINEKSFPIQQETNYKLKILPDDYVFLQEKEDLYLFNPSSKSFEKFFDGILDLKISPDLKKLAFFSKSEVWILFLKDNLEQPIKKAGERVFLTRLSEKIGNVFWLNSNYLIFSSGSKIKIAEIDDRDKINIVDLAEFKEIKDAGQPEIFFNQSDENLYVLSNEILYSSSPLLP
ncbi:MAG: hypothetical protein CO031_00470 [Candidatus Nealsonbacteria bacterium CG_4_9_14_0_2_um_filter_37_38]|uniref:PEGA domain-containing protein n=1 Tax=Candidatus Nealsonbacteria bacterium CG_4_10_14_0_8_um_filter_37_14 TaxID=1974684 RepID=A0A2M7R5R7_9BACT|nr:MAG: hypothetical protein COV63_02700 [Candidatus Nealsonbacteria bacterium CG11_big_fil_rev_8_21_14_0_20_37_68]PIW92092.1 MAG: hypothetical protein COZ89_01660 [Candidatus Nealsonbacteria bacterium CG_4_8_14_3_um_filter_37_23]PIY88765.1 MAG: hypothetical protein COY73_02985 [Candidatus Nealsonbacteria bacterium CG_4_10_14_0_8_um_filter_37_14]PJC51849.1 MAG: hypothetical protein CO031_00470 [Candidatus Nealsonbacteria bacterium CG_4_9_14_0_2_um_filter_37_38]